MPVLLKVGEPYMGKKRGWIEGVQYNFDQAGHILQMFFARPTVKEVEAIRTGKIDLALYTTTDRAVILLAYKAPGIPWSDAPYTWHRVPAERQVIPPALEGEQRAMLEIHLVDTATGLLRAMRRVSMAPEFSAHLHQMIAEQAATEADLSLYDRRLDGIYAKMDAETIASMAQVRCTGGD
jgi:hypothetical protein